MSGSPPTESVTTDAVFSFQPPAGGDLTLQSCDGVTFRVHSVLLGLASTVFAGMLTEATKPDTVELAEDAETISLMLAFIYPIDPPTITTVDQLEKIMLSSQKYDVERMIKFIEKSDRLHNQHLLSDPIRVFRASVKHKFPTVQALSARTFGLNDCNFHSITGIEELAGLFPESSSIIGLVGAQMVRDKLLSRLLKDAHVSVRPHTNISADSYSSYMACYQCWNQSYGNRGQEPGWYSPGWMSDWLSRLYGRLIAKPTDPCDDLLSAICIMDLHASNSRICSACVTQTLTKRSLFEQWARDTRKLVDKELEVLDKLYML